MSAARKWLLRALLNAVLVSIAGAQPFPPELYSGLRWRMIGPFRGGRTVAASGVPGQPNVFYIAANNGGVWKSTDAGRVWKPIFDDQDTGSIGALAVAPSDPHHRRRPKLAARWHRCRFGQRPADLRHHRRSA